MEFVQQTKKPIKWISKWQIFYCIICVYLTLETNFSNLDSVLTEIPWAIFIVLKAGHFSLKFHFYIVKCDKNNFVDTETKLKNLC